MSTILPENAANELLNHERTDNVSELKVLGDETKEKFAGDFVVDSLVSEGSKFGHVADIWVQDGCISYEEGMRELTAVSDNIRDIKAPLKAWKPVVTDEGRFAMQLNGRDFFPTDAALQNMAVAGKGSTWVLKDLNTSKTKPNDEDSVIFDRDHRDAELMKAYVELLLFQGDRSDLEKVRLWRTFDGDNTLRAMLSDDYTIVPNLWLLECLKRIIPGGLLSHWQGDIDSFFGNVLIPDSLREMQDSKYGGGVAAGNSEIGHRRLSSCPFVFRGICLNGCIWDSEKGKGISDVHRKKGGKIDLKEKEAQIKVFIEKQIPLIDENIRLQLATADLKMGDLNPLPVIAAVMADFKLPKKHGRGLMQAFGVEESLIDRDMSHSAFGVLQALTRHAQVVKNPLTSYKLKTLGGKVAGLQSKRWESILSRAASMDDKEIAKLTGISKD